LKCWPVVRLTIDDITRTRRRAGLHPVRGAGHPSAKPFATLLLQAPAPVVAQALGYTHSTTTRVATEAGTPGAATPPATM